MSRTTMTNADLDIYLAGLAVSGARKRQVRNEMLGLCSFCSRPQAYGTTKCERHLKARRARERARMKSVRVNRSAARMAEIEERKAAKC